MTGSAPIKINGDRLIARIEALAAMERKDDGTSNRLALTDADRRGRDQVVQWMREAGLQVRIDRIGNITGSLSGRNGGRPVMTGSHIDTVGNGGRYDGIYGVIAGAVALICGGWSGTTSMRCRRLRCRGNPSTSIRYSIGASMRRDAVQLSPSRCSGTRRPS